jgi:hypothetical protein
MLEARSRVGSDGQLGDGGGDRVWLQGGMMKPDDILSLACQIIRQCMW